MKKKPECKDCIIVLKHPWLCELCVHGKKEKEEK